MTTNQVGYGLIFVIVGIAVVGMLSALTEHKPAATTAYHAPVANDCPPGTYRSGALAVGNTCLPFVQVYQPTPRPILPDASPQPIFVPKVNVMDTINDSYADQRASNKAKDAACRKKGKRYDNVDDTGCVSKSMYRWLKSDDYYWATTGHVPTFTDGGGGYIPCSQLPTYRTSGYDRHDADHDGWACEK